MQMMLDDGIEKIRQGITTIEEVARVCPAEQEEKPHLLTCPDCGGMLPTDNPVCPHCQTTSPMTCRKCGAKLDEQWKVCPFCSLPVQQNVKPIVPQVPGEISVEPPVEAEAVSHPIRIVAADDEAHIRDMVKLLLEKKGYYVISAIDGQDALEKIHAELPDLIVLDVNMPKRDGFSTCKAIRSSVETMFIPVIMLTGQDSVEEKLEGLSSGADDYITKPFNAEELLARIDTVLRRTSRQKGSAVLRGSGE
jgi:CheY-like chemotaxis protein/RNA polymerase subunit RPABC4/transcription elongation factor Spt4